MKRLIIALVALALCLSAGPASAAAKEADTTVPRITKEELQSKMGKPGVVLLDVRLQEQWETSDQILPGAVHEDQAQTKTWAAKYPKNATIILY